MKLQVYRIYLLMLIFHTILSNILVPQIWLPDTVI